MVEKGRPAPEFEGIIAWINSPPLTMQDLNGKAILIDFWTYTCINCLRTLPYLKKWHRKYAKKGLVIVGVYSPEFSFEKDPANVTEAVRSLGIRYPVAVDSNMETWTTFGNHYWPAKYLIDKTGCLVYSHFGEGGYEMTERAIQKALGIEIPTERERPAVYLFDQSPETYAGFSKNFGLGSGLVCDRSGCNVYVDPGEHEPNVIYPHGQWVQEREFLELKKAPGMISYRFNAREVNVVMGPAAAADDKRIKERTKAGRTTVKADIFVDDKKIGQVDVDRPVMYTIFRNKKYGDRELTIVFNGPVRVYAFTFG